MIVMASVLNNLLCGRSVDEILRVLKSIQYVKENPGQTCPGDWKSGDHIVYSHPLRSNVYLKAFYSQKKI